MEGNGVKCGWCRKEGGAGSYVLPTIVVNRWCCLYRGLGHCAHSMQSIEAHQGCCVYVCVCCVCVCLKGGVSTDLGLYMEGCHAAAGVAFDSVVLRGISSGVLLFLQCLIHALIHAWRTDMSSVLLGSFQSDVSVKHTRLGFHTPAKPVDSVFGCLQASHVSSWGPRLPLGDSVNAHVSVKLRWCLSSVTPQQQQQCALAARTCSCCMLLLHNCVGCWPCC